MKTRTFALALVLLIGLIGLVGCSDDDDDGGTAPPTTGTVAITQTPADLDGAGWSLTGPSEQDGSGNVTLTGMQVGEYTVTWDAVGGYITPVSDPQTLVAGGTITFSGTYLEEGTSTQITTYIGDDHVSSWSPDGEWIAFESDRSGDSAIWRIPATGGEAILVYDGDGDSWPRWSHDGNWIAFYQFVTPTADIWIVPAAGGTAQQITTNQAQDKYAAWSPDDDTLAFASDRSGNWDIWKIPVTGGSPVQITTDTAEDTDPTWSPDGTWIAFVSDRSGSYEIWRIPATGGVAEQLTTDAGDVGNLAWSPSGGWIAFHSSRSTGTCIYVIPANGGETQQIISNAAHPGWSPDGYSITYTSNDSGNLDIWTTNEVPVGVPDAIVPTSSMHLHTRAPRKLHTARN